MKYVYDFSLEVPAPKAALDRANEVINQHAQKVSKDENVPLPSVDDETEILLVLLGLARLIEVNVRMAAQTFSAQEGLKEKTQPTVNYKNVLKFIDKYFKNDPVHELFEIARNVANGLVHGNFYQAYVEAEKAYEIDGLNLTQGKFFRQTVVLATITEAGLSVDAKTGIATTTAGKPTPHTSYVPSKGKTMEENFEAFYAAWAFIPVYDVLLTSFVRAYHYRKCISAAVEKSHA